MGACRGKRTRALGIFAAMAVAAVLGAASGCKPEGVTLEISSVGDTMAFDKTQLEAKAGSQVTLKLKNNATSAAMKHNWVLVKAGAADAVGTAGIQAGEAKGYVPDSADILAHTALTNPGGEATVTFTAPPPGDYPYICTFPGHFALMKGTLKSTP